MNSVDTHLTVTISQAAHMLSLSRAALYKAIQRGDIRAIKSGRRTLLEVAELQRFIAALPAYKTASRAN